jgi:hypothetical protein
LDRHNLDQRGWVELRIVEQRQLNRFAESGYVHAREQQFGRQQTKAPVVDLQHHSTSRRAQMIKRKAKKSLHTKPVKGKAKAKPGLVADDQG